MPGSDLHHQSVHTLSPVLLIVFPPIQCWQCAEAPLFPFPTSPRLSSNSHALKINFFIFKMLFTIFFIFISKFKAFCSFAFAGFLADSISVKTLKFFSIFHSFSLLYTSSTFCEKFALLISVSASSCCFVDVMNSEEFSRTTESFVEMIFRKGKLRDYRN